MEGILQQPQLAEIEKLFIDSFTPHNPVMYFPIRHHSPACAWHLQHVIQDHNPDLILIEGPADSMQLLPYIADETSIPPFCIYYSYDDKEEKVNSYKEKYRAYYPFLSYSPELIAIREGHKRHIPVQFIDMPYALQLVNNVEKESDLQFYYNKDEEYEINNYTAMLTRRSGYRSFSEFWESFFELEAEKSDTRSFVRKVFHLGYFMRLATPATSLQEDCQREVYMATQIRKNSLNYKRILVITGAFHVVGLMNEVKSGNEQLLTPYTKEATSTYLMPYTFKETDSRNGYAAGMPFPAFYQTIWEQLQKNEPNAYNTTILKYIISTAHFAKKNQRISLPDEINALNMARSLAYLRNKPTPGVYELLDGIKSSFIKGNANETSTFEFDFLLRLLSGMGAGKIAINNCLPPVVIEFRSLCTKYHLKTSTIERQKVTLDIIKNPVHRKKSCFLHQLQFLETGYSSLQSGPDYINQRNKNLVREYWTCQYSTQIETRLIDLSVYGSTLSQICDSLIEEKIKDNMTAQELGELLLSAQVMGLNDFYQKHIQSILQVIEEERNFVSLCYFLNRLRYLANMQQLTENKINTAIPKLGKKAFNEASYLIPLVKQTTEFEEQIVCEQMRNLYNLTLEEETWADSESFLVLVNEVLKDSFCNSRFYGLCLAIYYKERRIKYQHFSNRIAIYIESSINRPGQIASFICGLFLVARDILFTDTQIIEALERVICQIDNETFLTILPNLRYAFTCFLPTEINRLGHILAEKYHIANSPLRGSINVSMEEIAKAMLLDSQAAETLNTWSI